MLLGLALVAVDAAFFGLTNAARVPSGLLIVGFLLVALSIYVLFRAALGVLSIYGAPLKDHGKRPALYISLWAGLLVALQSLGELSPRDVVVLALLMAIAYLYTTYGRTQANDS